MRLLAAILIGVLLSGCEVLSSDEEELPAYPIQTDRTRYEARPQNSGRYSGVEVTIPMQFTNVTADAVYFVGCRKPPAPLLQKWQEGEWVTAWDAVELLCLSPPWVIAPGATFHDTLRVSGYWPGQNAAPVFRTEVPGRYRLIRKVHTEPDPLAPLVPEEARISNEFELAWASASE